MNQKQFQRCFFQKGITFEISIIAYFSIPKGVSKKSDASKHVLPTKKPNANNNIIKVILYALNDMAYHDGSQV